MSRVLLAWELGGGYGHLAILRVLAVQLRAAGHQCVFAVRILESAAEFLEPELGPVLQAPVRIGPARKPVEVQLSYASLLHNIGFDHPQGLAARINAWRELMRGWRIERVIAEHSPIAMIAARSLGLPLSTAGSGFMLPPLTRPFPSFLPWAKVDPAQLQANEAAVLAELNAALAQLRLPPYASLQGIFADAPQALLTYPELDHYDGRPGDACVGVADTARGIEPPWPDGGGPRVFAYMRAHPHLEDVVRILAASRARVLLRLDEVDPARFQQHARPGMTVVDKSVNLRTAALDCDAYVNYAGHGTVAEMLLAGKPGLLWPDTVERKLVARRAEQLGAAVVTPPQGSFDAAAALQRVLEDPALRGGAERFAQRYRTHDRAAIPGQMLRRLSSGWS